MILVPLVAFSRHPFLAAPFLVAPSSHPLATPTSHPLATPSFHALTTPSYRPLTTPSAHILAPLTAPSFHTLATPSFQPLAAPTSQPLVTPGPRPLATSFSGHTLFSSLDTSFSATTPFYVDSRLLYNPFCLAYDFSIAVQYVLYGPVSDWVTVQYYAWARFRASMDTIGNANA